MHNGFTCDEAGCIARLKDGTLVSVVLTAEAFEEDCARAALVLTSRTAPPWCKATVIDRAVWKRNGALALRRTTNGFDMIAARPPIYDRPWARAPAGETTTPPASPAATPAPDATPRPEDLDAGD